MGVGGDTAVCGHRLDSVIPYGSQGEIQSECTNELWAWKWAGISDLFMAIRTQSEVQ
jgi:hypothetical protein